MFHPSFIAASVFIGFAAAPVLAHDVQIAEDVGATLHIEPNDIAMAGAPTDIWFALTKAGGSVLPLADCDCQLNVYDQRDTVVSTPTLTPISAEGFNQIPGTTVIFPEVGTYELRLTGTPNDGAQFTPFELSFEVTVAGRAPGATSAEEAASPDSQVSTDGTEASAASANQVSQSAETPATSSTSNPWSSVMRWGSAVLIVGIVWGIVNGLRSPGGKP